MSKYLEDLLAGEKKAIEGKLCLHNTTKRPPVAVFADLTQNTKQAKEYEQMVMNRPNKVFNGVVEYCMSGMRFKIRLQQEGRIIGLNLIGVRTVNNDKNQPTLLEYANDAQKLAKQCLFQRDVVVELFTVDKRGSFFGTVQMPNKTDFALKLLQEGLAQIFVPNANRARLPNNFNDYESAEAEAKAKQIGIWGNSLKLMSSAAAGGGAAGASSGE